MRTEEINKKVVLDFIEKAVNIGDFDGAEVHFGTNYVQHNPIIPDGIEGFREHIQQLRQAFPQVRGEVKRIFADGDFVIVHMRAKQVPEDAGLAIVDFFRLEEGKLVEHWEVRQPIIEGSLHANEMI